ncbi:MAG: hypothetical protein IPN49_02760 [Saprospiraceae bacterium]|nr:hypothetical protein [Saprospiraceae bacterium]
MEKYFALIEDWIKTKDQTGEDVYIGEIEYRPFAQQGNRDNKYRLLVKKKLRKDGQLNMFTNESYDYHAIVTNDFSSSLDEAIKCYNRRGACEKQFDILKTILVGIIYHFQTCQKYCILIF